MNNNVIRRKFQETSSSFVTYLHDNTILQKKPLFSMTCKFSLTDPHQSFLSREE